MSVKRFLVEWSCEQEWRVKNWPGDDDLYVVLASDYDATAERADYFESRLRETERACQAAKDRIAALEAAQAALAKQYNAANDARLTWKRKAETLEEALRSLLNEVEYVISSESIPYTWLDEKEPDMAIVNARSVLEARDV